MLDRPTDVAVDASGSIYIADRENDRIRKVDTTGIITTLAGVEGTGLALDTLGNIFVAGYLSCRVRKVDTTGIITTVAGTGSCGYRGDGGPATDAQLC